MKDFDYDKEAKRIWALTEEQFMHECNTEPTSALPKYYIKLKDALMDMMLHKFVGGIQSIGYDETSDDNINMLRRFRTYITRLGVMQDPIRLKAFEADLQEIADALGALIKTRDTDLGYYV